MKDKKTRGIVEYLNTYVNSYIIFWSWYRPIGTWFVSDAWHICYRCFPFLPTTTLVVYVFTWPFYPFITDISPPELRGFDNRSHRPDDALILSRTMHALLLVSSRHYRQRMEAKGYFFLNGWKQKDLDCKFPWSNISCTKTHGVENSLPGSNYLMVHGQHVVL